MPIDLTRSKRTIDETSKSKHAHHALQLILPSLLIVPRTEYPPERHRPCIIDVAKSDGFQHPALVCAQMVHSLPSIGDLPLSGFNVNRHITTFVSIRQLVFDAIRDSTLIGPFGSHRIEFSACDPQHTVTS